MDNGILVCRGLTKIYKGFPALDGIDLTVLGGRIVGLLGPNGSGKTTLIKIIAGMTKQTAGDVFIEGNPPGEKSKAIISYLPDCEFLPMGMRLDKLLDYYADFFVDFDRNKAAEMIRQFGLTMDMTLKTMSKGMREKMHISMVMSRRAKLYLLDEPIGGVDPAARDIVLNTILNNYNRDATIIISTHLIYDVEKVLDDVIFINRGRIVLYDQVANVIAGSGKSLDARFREDFRCY